MPNAPATQRYRIVGSGPVALACALFMVRAGIDAQRLALRLPPIDAARPADAPARPADAARRTGNAPQRMLAISDGSRQLLSRVMTMPAGGTIERIEVVLAGRSGRTRIEARDFKVGALGHVIAYPALVASLRAAVDRLPLAAVEDAQQDAQDAAQEIVIHADGMPRPGDAAARGIRARDFRQSALLTEVMADSAGTTAYEIFRRHGPLALLPAGAGHQPRYAVVWCDEPEATAARAALSPPELAAELTAALSEAGLSSTALSRLEVCVETIRWRARASTSACATRSNSPSTSRTTNMHSGRRRYRRCSTGSRAGAGWIEASPPASPTCSHPPSRGRSRVRCSPRC